MANMFKDSSRFTGYQGIQGRDYTLTENGEPIFVKKADQELYNEYKELLFGHNTRGLKLELSFPFKLGTVQRLLFRRKYVHLLTKLHEENIKNRFAQNDPNFDLNKLIGFGSRLTPNKLPVFENVKQLNTHTFPFDNNLRNQLLALPKQLVYPPEVIVNPITGDTTKIYYLVGRLNNTNVLFRALETKTNDSQNLASCIKFSVVCRGENRGYFDLIRADYRALANHPNKFNQDGTVNLRTGDILPNSKTHIHLSTLEHDIIFPHSSSPDIIPYKNKLGKDFNSYEEMLTDFKDVFKIQDREPILTEEEMQQFGDMPLRDIYRNYCFAQAHFSNSTYRPQTNTQARAVNQDFEYERGALVTKPQGFKRPNGNPDMGGR